MIAYLANEQVWPVSKGGRVRMAGVVASLAAVDEVLVLACSHDRHPEELGRGETRLPEGVGRLKLPKARLPLAGFLSTGPRLGRSLIDRHIAAVIEAEVRAARCLVVSHSYLVPPLRDLGLPLVVDFPNLEVLRAASFAGASSGSRSAIFRLEAFKATRWEPTVARRSALALAVDQQDEQQLRGWGAINVAVLPNATDVQPLATPSPSDGYVLVVCNATYEPNRQALRELVRVVWPLVQARLPSADLVIAGSGTDVAVPSPPPGVHVAGYVDELRDLYAGAACLAFPVKTGAGTQLKVLEGLGHGLSAVATPYSARSVPSQFIQEVLVAPNSRSFARGLVELLSAVEQRHEREKRIRSTVTSDWGASCGPAMQRLIALVGGAESD